MTKVYLAYFESEIGLVEVSGTETDITGVNFVEARHPDADGDSVAVQNCLQQIAEYFRGERTTFDVPLVFEGTAFQQSVWQALLDVPFGKTASYGDIARAIGNPKAVRAVGGANAKNPISIIAPCHRIIGSDGSMTGYGGGLWRKEWLLAHEAKVNQSSS